MDDPSGQRRPAPDRRSPRRVPASRTKCGPEPPAPPDPPDPTDPPLPPDPPDPAGEPIGVFVDCVQDTGTTYDVVFGYQNQNEDAVRIPAGAANGFRPTPGDRGQVTEFLPGNVQRAFTVEGVAAARS